MWKMETIGLEGMVLRARMWMMETIGLEEMVL